MGIIEGARAKPGDGPAAGLIIRAVEISASQMRALNATPHTLVPTPGTGKAIVVEGFAVSKPAGTAFGGIVAAEDLEFRYVNATGLQIAQAETIGFLDSGNERHRWVGAFRPAIGNSAINAVNNGAVVVRNSGAITGGRSVFIWTYYRVIPVVLYV